MISKQKVKDMISLENVQTENRVGQLVFSKKDILKLDCVTDLLEEEKRRVFDYISENIETNKSYSEGRYWLVHELVKKHIEKLKTE